MSNPAENRMADFIISRSHMNDTHISYIDQDRQNLSEWSLGEPSSSGAPNEASHKELKSEDSWSGSTSGCVGASPRLEETGYEPASILSPNNVNVNSQFVQSPNLNAMPETLDLNAGFAGHGSDLESLKSSREDSTASGGSVMEDNGGRPGSSSDGGHLSHKRKAVEGHVGQSSMSENPGLGVPAPLERVNPTLELGLTGSAYNSIPNSAQASHPDTSLRNVRSRTHLSIQDSLPPPLSSTSLRQPVPLRTLPQNVQPFQWNEIESSSSRSGSLSSSATLRSRELGNLRSDVRSPTDGSVPDTIASTSGTGSSSDVNPLPPPNWASLPIPSSRSSRILAEYARRSLLSSANAESGGQSSNRPLHSGPAGSPEHPNSNEGHHRSVARSFSLTERLGDSVLGIPNPLRTLTAGEGRSGLLLSEIHNVLDLIRRGEGLRFEDFMITDQSIPFRISDIHDRHRDMRLDVDNMSYEELLALEERIGNVNTGLSEETILKKLKLCKFSVAQKRDVETEPCSVCQEKFGDGEDIGTLDCGHDYHPECIKQWLMLKNSCPICKTTGLAT